MSPEAQPPLPVNALATAAAATADASAALVAVPVGSAAPAIDDLGPAVCPTCGSVQIDAMDPLRAISGVLLSLLASLLGVVALGAVLAGVVLVIEDGPGLLLLGLAAGALAVFAGFSSHRIARRPARHQTACRVCGEREGRWTSTSSDASGVFATLFSGPLLLPGLSLLASAVGTIGTVASRTTLALFAMGGGLVAITFLIVRRPWVASRGTDWASGSTLGRLFIGGQGVGTSPDLRPHVPTEGTAKGLLSAEESLVADELEALVRRGALTLESRDDIVWSRLLSYHRMTVVPAELHAVLDLGASHANDESDFAEAIFRELRARAREEAGGDGVDYRADHDAQLNAATTKVRLSIIELLTRVGVSAPSARAVEGALRASIKARRVGSRAYASLRSAEPARLPVVRKSS